MTTDAALKARIHKEGLTVRYLHEVLFTNNSLTVTTAGNSSVTDSLAQIKTDAKALGITRFAEGLGWVCDDGKIFSQDNLKEGIIDNLA